MSSSNVCAKCPKNFHCRGGSLNDASKVACGFGETTLEWGEVSRDACLCMPGYSFVDGQCTDCSKGFYKVSAGNGDCTPCPPNMTTFSSTASSNASCVPEDVLAPAIDESQMNESVSNTFDVPAVSFSLSITANSNAFDTVAETVASAVRGMVGTSAIANVELVNTGQLSRRLSTEQTLMVTLKYTTAQEAKAFAQELDMNITSGTILEALVQNEELQVVALQASTASVSTLQLTCRPNAVVPPGAVVQDADDCVCSRGYAYVTESSTCSSCVIGQYKSSISNQNCELCPARKTTLNVGATSIQDCLCEPGTFENVGQCSDCQPGFFCPGTGKAEACPANTQSLIAAARTNASCLCVAGYFLNTTNGTKCEPCDPGRFKGAVSNDPCTQLCPANADSYAGAASLQDCFCSEDYHAILASNGQLDRCANCGSYVGLVCLGGFDVNSSNSSQHLQPTAVRGFYQTANAFAAKCRIVLPDGSSACRGNNQCGEGTTGILCGECPFGWARASDFAPCNACWKGAVGSLSMAILIDLTRIAVPNFVLAALAAMESANANLPLHTYMIRVFVQWFTACALITHFNLELLETPFTQPASSTGDCGEQYAQDSKAKLPARTDKDVVADVIETLRLSWPPEVSIAMTVMFDIFNVLPTFTSVQFSAQCRAFELFPNRPDVQRLAPALYYITLPVLVAVATFFVCALAVYVVVPIARRLGGHLNKKDSMKQKKRKMLQELLGQYVRNLPLSEIPLDLPNFRSRKKCITITETHESLAKEIFRLQVMAEPQLEDVLLEVDLDLEGLKLCPTEMLFRQVSREDLQNASW